MRNSLALLICRCPEIIQTVRDIVRNIDYLQLEVCDTNEQACRQVARKDIVLVLAHLGSLGGDDPRAISLFPGSSPLLDAHVRLYSLLNTIGSSMWLPCCGQELRTTSNCQRI